MSIPFRWSWLLPACALLLGACATRDDITKVKIFRLLPNNQQKAASDRAIAFERRYRLHGAVTGADVRARTGNYYTVFWTVADTSSPVTLRFRYRQAATGPKIHTIEQTIERPKHSNISEFHIIGDAYEKQGKVLAWQLELCRGNQVLATRNSYLWK